MILLDTHTLIWLAEDSRLLGPKTVKLTDMALARDEVCIAAISFWEIAMLVQKQRLQMDLSPAAMRRQVFAQGIHEVALSGEMGIAAAQLPGFQGDPADRMIVATALATGATLVTADESILRWPGQLRTHDARR